MNKKHIAIAIIIDVILVLSIWINEFIPIDILKSGFIINLLGIFFGFSLTAVTVIMSLSTSIRSSYSSNHKGKSLINQHKKRFLDIVDELKQDLILILLSIIFLYFAKIVGYSSLNYINPINIMKIAQTIYIILITINLFAMLDILLALFTLFKISNK